MNTPVNFELAKLLEQKGWDKPIDSRWFYDTEYFTYRFSSEGAIKWTPKEENSYPAPTIAEVVMWLYEKHDVWISLIPDISSGHQLLMRKMSVHLFRYRNGLNVQTETLRDNSRDIIYFLSPTEAYEAAIKYTLTKILTP